MKLFAKLNVFGKLVPAFAKKGLIDNEGAFGYFQITDQLSDTQLIAIDDALNGKEFAKVLIHELFHATLHRTHMASGMPDAMEEVVVEQLANAVIENLAVIHKATRRARAS